MELEAQCSIIFKIKYKNIFWNQAFLPLTLQATKETVEQKEFETSRYVTGLRKRKPSVTEQCLEVECIPKRKESKRRY